MKTQMGLWIDHAKAVIVALTDNGADVTQVESHADKQDRRNDGKVSRSHEPVAVDDKSKRAYVGKLNVYYDEVISTIRDAGAVLIFGPGEAKGELKKRLEENRLGDRVVAVQSADKMTDRQIAAKVREYFSQPAARH